MTSSDKTALDMLERSHRRLEERMSDLSGLLAAAADGHDGREERDAIGDIARFLRRSAANHIADEEESVFPRLDAEDLTAKLRHEHEDQAALTDELVPLLKELRDAITPEALSRAADLARRLDEAYRKHTALEDKELLPMVAALDETTRATIAAEMKTRREQNRGGGGGGRGRNR